jgi:hypothetical protein
MDVMRDWRIEERSDGPAGFTFAIVEEVGGRKRTVAWVNDRDDARFIHHIRGQLPRLASEFRAVLHYLHELHDFARHHQDSARLANGPGA